eukprot:CAMPEP_0204092908 /NCGR_PEP_ID=MMETSP0360-20130528/190151_1 /ASSEMBLY_ACC=CAM_ASM_000342 /TAXON_ID=268821 /ORGANISM="Scrippsiella Hangoei, Strain SHTV-5" /LENGTH=251 /DNA_ID=CAMNT_0051042195 /DNA_START=78 /DNA_END=835 /DNA_ORIENTATION=+
MGGGASAQKKHQGDAPNQEVEATPTAATTPDVQAEAAADSAEVNKDVSDFMALIEDSDDSVDEAPEKAHEEAAAEAVDATTDKRGEEPEPRQVFMQQEETIAAAAATTFENAAPEPQQMRLQPRTIFRAPPLMQNPPKWGGFTKVTHIHGVNPPLAKYQPTPEASPSLGIMGGGASAQKKHDFHVPNQEVEATPAATTTHDAQAEAAADAAKVKKDILDSMALNGDAPTDKRGEEPEPQQMYVQMRRNYRG